MKQEALIFGTLITFIGFALFIAWFGNFGRKEDKRGPR